LQDAEYSHGVAFAKAASINCYKMYIGTHHSEELCNETAKLAGAKKSSHFNSGRLTLVGRGNLTYGCYDSQIGSSEFPEPTLPAPTPPTTEQRARVCGCSHGKHSSYC
jgi:hypothetical protein